MPIFKIDVFVECDESTELCTVMDGPKMLYHHGSVADKRCMPKGLESRRGLWQSHACDKGVNVMQRQNLGRMSMLGGLVCTALMALLFIRGMRSAVWGSLALGAGAALAVGAAAEIVQKWEQFQRSPDPLWMTGIRFVFTLLGACFAPWLVLGILGLIQSLLV